MKIKNIQKGFSLVELILYVAILSLVVSLVTVTAVSLLGTFTHLRASQDVAEASIVAFDRMTREIRFSSTITTGASVLSTHPGVLTLNTVDDYGNPTSVTFSLVGGRIMLTEGGVSSPLTRSNVVVSNLIFTRATGTSGDAVRIEMTTQKSVRGYLISKDFRTFVVLKG